MPTAQIIPLEKYRPLTPVQKLRADKEKLKSLLSDCMPQPQPSPLIIDLKDEIEQSAKRYCGDLGQRLAAVEQQLADLLTKERGNA